LRLRLRLRLGTIWVFIFNVGVVTLCSRRVLESGMLVEM
jgi:hypothetical protein